jgi:hypothetical protein
MDVKGAENPNVRDYSEKKFYVLLGIYVGVWGMMPMLTIKLIPLNLEWMGLGVIAFSYGAFTHAITFPCTDAVTEIWGSGRARILVYLGFFSFLLAMTLVYIGTLIPPMPFWMEENESYKTLFSSAPQFVLASILASLSAQLLDVSVFARLKRLTGRHGLWIRNNASTMISQFVDTGIFYSIAFYGMVPLSQLPKLILATYLVKIAIAAVDTPVVYLVVRWITGEWHGSVAVSSADEMHD